MLVMSLRSGRSIQNKGPRNVKIKSVLVLGFKMLCTYDLENIGRVFLPLSPWSNEAVLLTEIGTSYECKTSRDLDQNSGRNTSLLIVMSKLLLVDSLIAYFFFYLAFIFAYD